MKKKLLISLLMFGALTPGVTKTMIPMIFDVRDASYTRPYEFQFTVYSLINELKQGLQLAKKEDVNSSKLPDIKKDLQVNLDSCYDSLNKFDVMQKKIERFENEMPTHVKKYTEDIKKKFKTPNKKLLNVEETIEKNIKKKFKEFKDTIPNVQKMREELKTIDSEISKQLPDIQKNPLIKKSNQQQLVFLRFEKDDFEFEEDVNKPV